MTVEQIKQSVLMCENWKKLCGEINSLNRFVNTKWETEKSIRFEALKEAFEGGYGRGWAIGFFFVIITVCRIIATSIKPDAFEANSLTLVCLPFVIIGSLGIRIWYICYFAHDSVKIHRDKKREYDKEYQNNVILLNKKSRKNMSTSR